jgi:N-acetylmuramic acid 6-phosphate etherase
MQKTTESSSNYDGLEKMSTLELLSNINKEDKTVPLSIEKELNNIEKFIDAAYEKMSVGGRLFYIGAGTSGRLGIVDASECPPTYGVPFDLVNGIIAGGDGAIRKAVEFAEDDFEQGWKDLIDNGISAGDVLVGIAASGSTPYVIGGLKACRANNILTGSISCNANAPVS